MFSEFRIVYLVISVFGVLLGTIAGLIFVRLFNLPGYKKVLSFVGWIAGNGIIVGAIIYMEHLVKEQASKSAEPAQVYAHFITIVTWYLGGFGVGGLAVLTHSFKRMFIDQAFIDVFLPLRKDLADREVQALALFLVPKAPSLWKKLWSRISRRPLPVGSPNRTPDEAAVAMGVTRQVFDDHLASGLRKLAQYVRAVP